MHAKPIFPKLKLTCQYCFIEESKFPNYYPSTKVIHRCSVHGKVVLKQKTTRLLKHSAMFWIKGQRKHTQKFYTILKVNTNFESPEHSWAHKAVMHAPKPLIHQIAPNNPQTAQLLFIGFEQQPRSWIFPVVSSHH